MESPPPVTIDKSNLVGSSPVTSPVTEPTAAQSGSVVIVPPEPIKPEVLPVTAAPSEPVKPEVPPVTAAPSEPVKPDTTATKPDTNKPKPQKPTIQATTNTTDNLPSIESMLRNSVSQPTVLENKENSIKILTAEIEKLKNQNQSMSVLRILQPAFQNIQQVLEFQGKELNNNRDFDSQHYTVPLAQSLFNLTANQITGLPSWRH
jgi:hypothetical protein